MSARFTGYRSRHLKIHLGTLDGGLLWSRQVIAECALYDVVLRVIIRCHNSDRNFHVAALLTNLR